MGFAVVDPASGLSLRSLVGREDADVERQLDRANVAYGEWRATPMSERARLMHRLAKTLREGADHHAAHITEEMGKPIREAKDEVEKCAQLAEHYADKASEYLATEDVVTDARASYVRYDPIGPILAIMPWNYPYWQILRCAVPALMAGNTVLVKPAHITAGCAEALVRAFRTAGFPEGVFDMFVVDEGRIEDIIHDDRIAAVSFTGSPESGAEVAEAAAGVVKKVVLELGGSDPFIVLEDADLDAALDTAVRSRCQANGECCVAAKRFIVEDAIHDAFVDGLVARMGTLKMGDPLDPQTEIGPLARADIRDILHRQVTESVRMGASLRLGGAPARRDGHYYPPTVLTETGPGMPVFDEETFGPVAAVTRVQDEDDAVRLANATRYGLGATVWAGDATRGERIAAQLDVGVVAINDLVKSDPRLPFGGVKGSGYGRELGRLGILEFVNAKSIWVGPA